MREVLQQRPDFLGLPWECAGDFPMRLSGHREINATCNVDSVNVAEETVAVFY